MTPGFIDGHTHMDAQVFWDPLGSSLVLARRHHRRHGPLRLHPGAGAGRPTRNWSSATSNGPRTSPARRMAAGIDWTWTTFAEYLDAVDRLPKGINYAANRRSLRPAHLRDGRAGLPRAATATTWQAMEAELGAPLQAGAYGFTTSRTHHHETSDNRPVASRIGDLGRGESAGRGHGPHRSRHLSAGRGSS